jgi:hypothetical protein
MYNPAIVVLAYDRPDSLQRLLRSINQAVFNDADIMLHISIDKSESGAVVDLANDFEWKHGKKIVEVKTEHLGLKEHVLRAGDLTKNYGAIIMLEDDLFVGKHFYKFACESIEFYRSDKSIAGVSLYSYEVAESCGAPFSAIDDDSDVYFMKIASSWGQAWTQEHWLGFRDWLSSSTEKTLLNLPGYIKSWGQHSWKKMFISYLIDQDKYFVYPQKSFTTNFEDPGTNATTKDLYQVELSGADKSLNFQQFKNSKAVYDEYFELTTASLKHHAAKLREYDFEVDLYGRKNLSTIKSQYLLTTRSGLSSVMQFSTKMRPLFMNVVNDIDGNGVGLFLLKDVEEKEASLLPHHSMTIANREQGVNGILSISIVIVVLNLDKSALAKTLGSVDYSGPIECILFCPEKDVRSITEIAQLRFQHLNIRSLGGRVNDDFLHLGLDQCSNEIMTWCAQGSSFESRALDQLPKIFNGFHQVDWINGIDEDVNKNNYSKLNTAPYRWNPHLFSKYGGKKGRVSSEFMFFRRSTYNKMSKEDRSLSENLIQDLFVLAPIHTVAYRFGNKITKSLPSSRESFDYEKASIIGRMISSMSYPFYIRNLSPFRLLLVEAEHLPFVLRFDSVHETFYVSKY